MTDKTKPGAPAPESGAHPAAHDAAPAHVPEAVKPPAPVKPKRGFDPESLKGKGGKGFGPVGKRMVIPGKGRSR